MSYWTEQKINEVQRDMYNLAAGWRHDSIKLTQQQLWDLLITSADLTGSLASGAVAVPCTHEEEA